MLYVLFAASIYLIRPEVHSLKIGVDVENDGTIFFGLNLISTGSFIWYTRVCAPIFEFDPPSSVFPPLLHNNLASTNIAAVLIWNLYLFKPFLIFVNVIRFDIFVFFSSIFVFLRVSLDDFLLFFVV